MDEASFGQTRTFCAPVSGVSGSGWIGDVATCWWVTVLGVASGSSASRLTNSGEATAFCNGKSARKIQLHRDKYQWYVYSLCTSGRDTLSFSSHSLMVPVIFTSSLCLSSIAGLPYTTYMSLVCSSVYTSACVVFRISVAYVLLGNVKICDVTLHGSKLTRACPVQDSTPK